MPDEKIDGMPSDEDGGVRAKEDIFRKMEVPEDDGSGLFWAVTMAHLLPVRNNEHLFGERFRQLFGAENVNKTSHVQQLVLNNTLHYVYEDEIMVELVRETLRNRVIDEMEKQEAELSPRVTFNDILSLKNAAAFITDGTFSQHFQSAFPSEIHSIDLSKLKPAKLNHVSIGELNAELDKVSADKNTIQKFKFSAYLKWMRSCKPSAGIEIEIAGIQTLLKCKISVLTAKENFTFDNILKNGNYIFLFNKPDDGIGYKFALADPRIIMERVKKADYKLALKLVRVGVEGINYQDEIGWTLLHYATLTDNYHRMIERLVDQSADLSLKNRDGKTVLELAQFLQLEKAISTIKSYLSDFKEIRNKEKLSDENVNKPPKLLLAEIRLVENEENTIEIYANPKAMQNEYHENALKCGLLENQAQKTSFLLEMRTDISPKTLENTVDFAPLHYAARTGSLALVTAFIENSAIPVDIKDEFGRTPMRMAVECGHLPVVKYLIDKGANVSAKDDTSLSALSRAAEAGFDHIVDYLLEKGAEANAVDANGMTALHYSAHKAQWKAVQSLVEHEADVNIVNNEGQTPLSTLISKGNWEIVRYLLENGALLSGLSDEIKGDIYQRFIVSSDKGDHLHQAIALGNVELLQRLMRSFSIPNEAIYEIYNEFRLYNVKLSSEITIFIENKLIDDRYFSDKSISDERTQDTLHVDNLKKRLKLVSGCISSLVKDFSKDNEISDAFLFIGKFISKNMQILKRQMRCTCEVLPWEEMQFCLIIFLLRCTEASSKVDAVSISLVLNKKRLLSHLSVFNYELGKLEVDQLDFNKKLVKNRVIESSEFRELGKDFERLKDLYSLSKIASCLKVVGGVDLKKEPEVGKLVIERGLQVTGECLKNTADSPNLSEKMQLKLMDFAPLKAKKLISSLRDDLSHVETLNERVKLESRRNVHYFRKIQNDLMKLRSEIVKILYNLKIKIAKSFFKRIIAAESFDEIVDIISSLRNIGKNQRVFRENDSSGKDRNLEKDNKSSRNDVVFGWDEIFNDGEILDEDENNSVIEKIFNHLIDLKTIISDQSESQRVYLAECDAIIESMRTKSRETRDVYADYLREIRSILNLIRLKKDKLEEIGSAARVVLSRLAHAHFEHSGLVTEIIFLVQNLESAFPQFPKNAESLLIKTLKLIRYEMRALKGIDQFQLDLNLDSGGQNIDIEVLAGIDKQFLDFLSEKVVDLKLKEKISAEFADKKLVFVAKNKLIEFFKRKKKIDIDRSEFFALMKKVDFRIILKTDGSLDAIYEQNENSKCKQLIDRLNGKTNDSYAKFVKLFIDRSEIDFSKNVASFIKTFKCLKNLPINFDRENFSNEKITVNFSLKKYFFQKLQLLENVFLNPNNSKKSNSELINSLKSNQQLRLAIEMLVLILTEILENISLFEPNSKFLDVAFPVLIGKNLRNYLAHGDILIDLLSIDPIKSIIYHARMIQKTSSKTQSIVYNANNRIGKTIIEDIDRLEIDYRRNLRLINNLSIDIVLKTSKYRDVNGWTRLFLATQSDNLELFQELLSNHQLNIYYRDKLGHTLLFYLVQFDSRSILSYLIDTFDINPNIVLSRGKCMLHLSTEFGYFQLTRWLLSIGVDVNQCDDCHLTPLHYAANSGCTDIVLNLLNAGAHVLTEKLASQLEMLLGDVEILQRIIPRDNCVDHIFNLTCQLGHLNSVKFLIEHNNVDLTVTGHSALRVAVDRSHVEIVRLLLDNGASAHTNPPLLHLAATKDNLDIMQMLVEKGCDVNAIDTDGSSPVIVASAVGNYRIVEFLWHQGADVNMGGENDWTALHHAAAGSYTKTARVLLNAEANANAPSLKDGKTPLHIAAHMGNVKIMRMLVKRGAEINVADKCGDYPSNYAIFNNKKQSVAFLLEYGAEVNVSSCLGSSPLHTASTTGHVEILKMLLEKDPELQKNATGNTPLHLCALYGHEECLEALIKKYKVTEDVDVDVRTALHFAARSGNAKSVAVLLKYGANVDAVDNNHRTPSHYAVQEEHYSSVEKLLAAANVLIQSSKGYTILHTAVNSGYVNIAKLILKINTDKSLVNIKTYAGYSALLLASSSRAHFQLIKLLVENGADVNNKTPGGATALHYAVASGNCRLVELLLDHGAEINAEDGKHLTSVQLAAIRGYRNVLKVLLKRGAEVDISLLFYAIEYNRASIVITLIHERAVDVNAKEGDLSPLHVAAKYGRSVIAEILLKNGAIVEVRDPSNKTPLHYAAVNGHHEVIKVLHKYKANLNVKDTDNYTAFHWATIRGHNQCLLYLLLFGVDVFARAINASTALHYAAIDMLPKTVKVLLNHQKSMEFIDQRDALGRTALYVATLKNSVEIASILVEAGADVNIATRNTVLPLHFAIMMGNLEMVKLLLKAGTDLHLRLVSKRKLYGDAMMISDAESAFGITALHLAVQYNKPSAKQRFVSLDHNYKIKDSTVVEPEVLSNPNAMVCGMDNNDPALANATYNEHVLELILKEIGTDSELLNEGDSGGDTPLMWAVRDGNLMAVELLLNCAELDKNRGNFEGWTALHMAAQIGDLSLVELLLSFNVDIRVKNCDNISALEIAIHYGHLNVVRVLINKGGAELFEGNHTLLHRAVRYNEILELILNEMRIKSLSVGLSELINARDEHGQTPLMRAVKLGNVFAVRLLLDCRDEIDVNISDSSDAFTALHLALQFKHFDIAELLIKSGADVSAKNEHDSVLHLALDNLDILKLVLVEIKSKLNGDADGLRSVMNAADAEGDTPLMWAVERGNLSAAKLLLECDEIDINTQNLKGWTALHWSVRVGHPEMVYLLVDKNAEADIKDKNGETAFDVAHKIMSEDEKYELIAALILSVT